MTQGVQIPLPIRREDFATWHNWISRPATLTLEQWLSAGPSERGSAYLWGGAGTGKSHLLQASCELAGYEARYIPLRELRDYPPDQVLAGADAANLIALDDIDSIEHERAWHESLFALYNHCEESGACLLVTARRPPQQMEQVLADLRSRLSSLPVFQLPNFSEDHVAELLRLRASAAGMQLSADVVSYCTLRLPRDASAVVTFVQQLDQLSLSHRRTITIPFVRESGLLNQGVAR
ncbi:MAG: DnaA regulatory inactivator Hda [Luminiphilus sp.]|nr:DnaA regulatory inactivator Hda [Luminiphilus sp.]